MEQLDTSQIEQRIAVAEAHRTRQNDVGTVVLLLRQGYF